MSGTAFPWPSLLARLLAGEGLDRTEARGAMAEVMAGAATPAQVAAFIVALRLKGESVDEMAGMVEAMYDAAVTVDVGVPVVDVVGTGGDGAGTFNISTTAGLIAAGAGARVAKHGNRAASSRSGSADVLEALGLPLDLPPALTVRMIREAGFGFFFAPAYHPAMRHAAPVRRELGVPTVFNVLGPLANPARARMMAVGVGDPRMAERMVGVLASLGCETAFVFYGEDGLDELTTAGTSFIYRLKDGAVTHAEFTPEDFGVARAVRSDLAGGDAAENAAITRAVLAGEPGPRRDIALVNALPAIVAAGLAEGFSEAMPLAEAAVDSGAAAAALDAAVAIAREDGADG
ncbi:MAG: anthranilate phosphoribosyltransferase [Actinobacteria bacterium]|nr:anthranilate phosphoribosyltransferase [Actinomycetota bacterium]